MKRSAEAGYFTCCKAYPMARRWPSSNSCLPIRQAVALATALPWLLLIYNAMTVWGEWTSARYLFYFSLSKGNFCNPLNHAGKGIPCVNKKRPKPDSVFFLKRPSSGQCLCELWRQPPSITSLHSRYFPWFTAQHHTLAYNSKHAFPAHTFIITVTDTPKLKSGWIVSIASSLKQVNIDGDWKYMTMIWVRTGLSQPNANTCQCPVYVLPVVGWTRTIIPTLPVYVWTSRPFTDAIGKSTMEVEYNEETPLSLAINLST